MNEQDLKQLRPAAEATAARQLLHKTLPTEPGSRAECIAAWQRKLVASRADYLQMTFPEKLAVESDLWAGEAQEAFDRLAVDFEAIFSRGEA